MNKFDNLTVLALLAIVILVITGPLISIWALNTLFPVLAIPYSIETWLAVIVFGGLFKTSVTYKK
jgi:hypothetical protein